jgi:hypothetical protein
MKATKQPTFSKIPVQASALSNIQPKLKVNTPRDRYEQEADRIADQVVQQKMPVDEKNQKVGVQARASQQAPKGECEVNKDLENRLSRNIGGGSPMSDQVRAFFEPRMQNDFSKVKVHTDNEAARMNQELGARAFTHGRDIYFGVGQYNPHSIEGKRFLAHELTHVIQQSRDRDTVPALQRAQTGRPTPQASYFTYELDAEKSTYDALASHYGVERWQDIRDATPGRPAATALSPGTTVRIPARHLPTGTVQVVGTEPALVVSAGTIGVNFRWGNNSNANRIGRASRGTNMNAGATVSNNFRRAWIESTNLQDRAEGAIEELRVRNRTAGNNVYGYLPTPNIRLASRNVPTTDVNILARMIFGEQRNQGRAAMVVAAWIVRNRYDAGWGGSYADLLTDQEFHALRTTRSQNMTRLTGADARLWTTAQQVAQGVIDGTIADPTGGRGFYFGNGSTVQQRMDFCRRNTTGYHTAQVAGTNLFWSNGDYTGGTIAAPRCGQPQRR